MSTSTSTQETKLTFQQLMEKRLREAEQEKQALTHQVQDLKHKNTRLESEKNTLVKEKETLTKEKEELTTLNESLLEKQKQALAKKRARRQDRRNQRQDAAPATMSSRNKKFDNEHQNNDPPSLVSLSLDSSNADVSTCLPHSDQQSQAPSFDDHVPFAVSPQAMYHHQLLPFGYYHMPPVSNPYAQAGGMSCPPLYPMYAPGYSDLYYDGAQGNDANGFAQEGQFEDNDYGEGVEEGMSCPLYYPMYAPGYNGQFCGGAHGNDANGFAQDGQFGDNGPGEGNGETYQTLY